MTLALTHLEGRKMRSPTVRNVLDYWTTADGDDDYPALQRAINAAEASGPARVYMPEGLTLSKPVQITKPIHLFGDGIDACTVTLAPANNGLMIDSKLAVKMNDFTLNYSAPAAAGTAAITLDCTDNTGPGIYGNSSSVFRDLRVLNAEISMNVIAAQAFVIDNFKSLLHGRVAVKVANEDWPDAGDAKLVNSYMQGRDIATTLASVWWNGGGAFSINNNVLLTGQYGALVQLPDGAKTRQLFIQDNTIDGASNTAIGIWPLGSVPEPFGGVMINNNIFNLTHNGVLCALPPAPVGKWIATLIIGPNNWYPDAVTPAGVYLDASAVTTLLDLGHLQG